MLSLMLSTYFDFVGIPYCHCYFSNTVEEWRRKKFTINYCKVMQLPKQIIRVVLIIVYSAILQYSQLKIIQ